MLMCYGTVLSFGLCLVVFSVVYVVSLLLFLRFFQSIDACVLYCLFWCSFMTAWAGVDGVGMLRCSIVDMVSALVRFLFAKMASNCFLR